MTEQDIDRFASVKGIPKTTSRDIPVILARRGMGRQLSRHQLWRQTRRAWHFSLQRELAAYTAARKRAWIFLPT
jgi:hypothetical protein